VLTPAVGTEPRPAQRTVVLVGGAGFVGRAVTPVLRDSGARVVVVDRRPPRHDPESRAVGWVECDLLTDEVVLPPGELVILAGSGDPRPRWPWTLPLDIALTTARLLPAVRGRSVTLISSVEVYGNAPPPLVEDTPPSLPVSVADLEAWCDDVVAAARQPCPPWRVAGLCRRLAEADPSGRWVYGMSKLAQEILVRSVVDGDRCTILRLANTFGVGQDRVVTRLVRGALRQRPVTVTPAAVRSFLPVDEVGRILVGPLGAGVFNIGNPPIRVGELAETIGLLCGSAVPQQPVPSPASDSCGVVDTRRAEAAGMRLRPLRESLADIVERIRTEQVPRFDPPVPVVIPPRPARPDIVADRQQAAMWSGCVKHGNRWTTELEESLRRVLELDVDDELLVTKSGTNALRLMITGTVGPAWPGDLALLPSFTFRATADVLVQLGYGLRYLDVDPWSWTLDPAAVETALSDERVRLVICVDTFGNPCAYEALIDVCGRKGVPLLADSAAALGSTYRGRPIGRQADGHAFSMSFAKALTAAGAGGAVVFRAGRRRRDLSAWLGSSLMDELHAAAALDQLVLLPELVDRRNRVAQAYERAASRAGGLVTQGVAAGNQHSYVHWVAQVPDRACLQRRLAQTGVHTKPYFPAQHIHHELAGSPRPHLPVSETLDRHALAFPMSSELCDDKAAALAEALEEAVAREEAVDRTALGLDHSRDHSALARSLPG
jgi:dTDP-4-amino-4,6-dideoxygalactose transaminase/nucleoside-diphosphate-sugar epimerase